MLRTALAEGIRDAHSERLVEMQETVVRAMVHIATTKAFLDKEQFTDLSKVDESIRRVYTAVRQAKAMPEPAHAVAAVLRELAEV